MFTFTSTVRYSECNENAVLSMEGLINYLQDCSTFQSESLGVGLSFMKEQHFSWFISAWQIDIRRRPHFGEPITIATWCTDLSRVEAHRNFTIRDATDTICVQADSLWFVFDTNSSRPVRVPESEQVYLQGDLPLDMPPTQRRIALTGDYKQVEPIAVSEAHLDTNGHVNNAQYVRIATDALTEPLDAARLLVSYRKMALLGDIIIPRVYSQEDGAKAVELVSPNNETYAVIKMYPHIV